MRKVDEHKSLVFGKATKTINFDKIVLKDVEKKAREQGTTVSNIVNMICRQHVLGDRNFHRAMMKEHMMRFHEHKYLAEELEVVIE